MFLDETNRIALINGKKVKYEICAEDKTCINRINGIRDRIEYLGFGIIYSIDNIKYNDTTKLHFWRFIKKK